MRSRASLSLVVLLVAVWSACQHAPTKPARRVAIERHMPALATSTTLRVASFNILQAGNKAYPWEERRDSVAACLRDMDPDIFGVQEALIGQLDDLMDAFPDYTCIGRGRDDGGTRGEFMGLFYRTNRFVLKQAEVFWLSDTPEIPGSNTWGAACVRCATVAILIDRDNETSLGVCNTHLDHISAAAREKGAALIRKRLPTYGKGLPWIVTGDFNSPPGSVPYVALVEPEGSELRLADTFAAVHPSAPPATSSLHGYVEKFKGTRIDWILASPEFKPLAAGINQFKYRGRYPSDHFAVWADLKGKAAPIKRRKPRDRAGLPTETVDERQAQASNPLPISLRRLFGGGPR